LARDLADLETFGLPPAPVHLANSTDPFQLLEEQHRHTKLCLEGLLAYRHRFKTVTVLTKNPGLAAREQYLDLFRRLAEVPATHPCFPDWHRTGQPAAQVEVSLAFWQEEAAAFWDPGAPGVADRLAGIRELRQAGVPVVLRIDPLIPRSPAGPNPAWSLGDFGLPEAQTLADLECLIRFAKEVGVRHIVYSPAKIVLTRGHGLEPAMAGLRRVYERLAAPDKLLWRGLSWRLPWSVSDRLLVRPLLDLCHRWGVPAKFCRQNLIETI
jgi:DNA repair photolyase